MQLARLLSEYKTSEGASIKSRSTRFGPGKDGTKKSYYRESLEDAWTRYLPAKPTQPHTTDTQNPALQAGCAAVSVVSDSGGGGAE